MKNNIKNILISILIFIVYYFFPHIIDFLLKISDIDISKFNRTTLIVFIYITELIPLLFLTLIYKKDLKRELKTYKENFKENIDNNIRLWLLALFLMTISNSIISTFTGSEISNNEEAVRNITKILPIYSVFATCIAAPIVEELIYRKTIGNIFTNKKVAIVMSGFIFGIAHVIGTYTGLIDLLYIIPYGAFGSIFMYMYLDSKSIWSTITIHFLHNSILIAIQFLM